MKPRSLKDKVIVVTGAGGGLGAALGRKFALLEAKVILIDLKGEAMQALAAEVIRAGSYHAPECKVLDITDEHAFGDAITSVKEAYGSLDVMVNNAGILLAGEARDMNMSMFRQITELNLMGVVNGSLSAYKVMVAQGHGKIINISSISGLIASPLYSAYSMTKHAVIGLSKALSEEGRSLGVDVMVVCPGTLRTGIFDAGEVVNAPKDRVFKESLLSSISADEAAAKVIASINDNRFMTVFPRYASLMWFLEKIHPVLLAPLHQKILKNFRSHRGN